MRIFISYRRSDTQHLAGRLADRLRADAHIDEVFLDVDGIAPGDDFESKITAAITSSAVCLVLIGPGWLGRSEADTAAAPATRPRIFDEHDFIRLETRVALTSGRQVIPVLVEDMKMPAAGDLPADLRKLPRLNGISIRHLHFNRDIENLLDALPGRAARQDTPLAHPRRTLLGHLLRGFAGISIAAVVLIGLGFIHNVVTGGRALDESFGGRGQVWLLIAGILALGALMPSALHWFRRAR